MLIGFAFMLPFIHKRDHEIKLEELIRTDCLYFDRLTSSVEDYFNPRNKQLEEGFGTTDKNKAIEPDKMSNKSLDSKQQFKAEGNMNKTISSNNDGRGNNQINNLDQIDAKDNNPDKLVLRDNIVTPVNDNKEVVMVNNFVDKEKAVDVTISEDKNEDPTDEVLNKITLPDYNCLKGNEVVVSDFRPSRRFLKDEILTYHLLIAMIFKISIVNPVFIRSTKLCLQLSLLFGFNAILYSDYYITQRALTNSTQVIFV
jgi:hypothetical protein